MGKTLLSHIDRPNKAVFVLLLLLVGFLAGCGSLSQKLQESQCDYITGDPAIIWQICQRELKKRGFELDRVDRRSGTIETFPLTSRQWFEFWRQDVVGEAALMESSLHTVRRIVSVQLQPAEGNRSRLQCQVAVERLSASRPSAGGLTRAEDIFSDMISGSPALGPQGRGDYRQRQWVPLGRDLSLEKAIMTSISRVLPKLPEFTGKNT